jgi:CelD/BcsL family acetyltransferase involved in cellulose biosynthesis
VYAITEVTTDAGFDALRSEWDGLLARSAQNRIFLTWEWMRSWWEVYGGAHALRILIARREDGRLEGIAPLMLMGGRAPLAGGPRLEFIGCHSVSSEYLDFICDRERAAAVAEPLLTHLADRGGWNLLLFYRMPADSTTRSAIAARLRAGGCRAATTRIEEGLYLPLPADFETFLKTLGHDTRYNVRRYRKRAAERLGAAFVVRRDSDGGLLAEVSRIHQVRMTGLGRLGSFAAPRFAAFHQRMARRAAERGWLRVYLLQVGGRTVAVRYGFAYAGVFSDYSIGFDPAYERHYLGFVLLGHAIEACIAEGLAEFDFLGPGEYKERWNPARREKVSVAFARSRMALGVHLALTAARRRAYGVTRGVLPAPVYGRLRNLKTRLRIRLGKRI